MNIINAVDDDILIYFKYHYCSVCQDCKADKEDIIDCIPKICDFD
jgi:hypothetical protein